MNRFILSEVPLIIFQLICRVLNMSMGRFPFCNFLFKLRHLSINTEWVINNMYSDLNFINGPMLNGGNSLKASF